MKMNTNNELKHLPKGVVLLCILTLFSDCFVFAQNFEPSDKRILFEFEDVIAPIKSFLAKSNQQLMFSIIITISVGIFGIISSTLIKIGKSWSSNFAMGLGVVVSTLTVLHNTLFESDYREYRKAVVITEEVLLNIDETSKQLKHCVDYQDSLEAVNDIEKNLKRFYKTKASFVEASDPSVAFLELSEPSNTNNLRASVYSALPLVFQDTLEVPNWVNVSPSTKNYLYFVGKASDSKLSIAKELARETALEISLYYWREKFYSSKDAIDIERLSQYLVESAEIEKTYFNFSENDKVFNYYVLTKFDKELISAYLKLFSIVNQTKIPSSIQQKIDNSEAPEIEEINQRYYRNRLDVRNSATIYARETLNLSPEAERQYKTGRNHRIKQEYEKAINILNQVISESPSYYLGWLDLALAYDGNKQWEHAEEAYIKSAELDSLHNSSHHDASVYNSYGFFPV